MQAHPQLSKYWASTATVSSLATALIPSATSVSCFANILQIIQYGQQYAVCMSAGCISHASIGHSAHLDWVDHRHDCSSGRHMYWSSCTALSAGHSRTSLHPSSFRCTHAYFAALKDESMLFGIMKEASVLRSRSDCYCRGANTVDSLYKDTWCNYNAL